MSHILHVKVEGVRCSMGCLEDGQRFPPEMRTDRIAVIEREQEAQVREIRFEECESSEIMCAVARNDAQPGVQQVVRLLEEATVVNGHRLHRLGRLVLERTGVGVVQHERERALTEEVAVDLQFRERIAELLHRGARRVVDQHLSGRVSGDT